MGSEIYNFIKVWIIAVALGCYCYTLLKITPKGILRLMLVIPVIFLFTILSFSMPPVYLGAPTFFILVWLGNFKLLLFSFNKGPLISSTDLYLAHFLCTLLLPIKIKQEPLDRRSQKKTGFWRWFGLKFLALTCLMESYRFIKSFPYVVVLGLYCCHIYIALDIIFAITTTLARVFLQFQLAPQFKQPHLTTSLQDFWGRRWNLMVSDILRQTIHNPIRINAAPFIGRKQARVVGIFVSFLVSGLMHELIFYHLTQASPTWEVTSFFVLHGLGTSIEVIVKDEVCGKWQLYPMISRLLTIGFLAVTSVWLFFPPLHRIQLFENVIDDYFTMVDSLERNGLYYLSH